MFFYTLGEMFRSVALNVVRHKALIKKCICCNTTKGKHYWVHLLVHPFGFKWCLELFLTLPFDLNEKKCTALVTFRLALLTIKPVNLDFITIDSWLNEQLLIHDTHSSNISNRDLFSFPLLILVDYRTIVALPKKMKTYYSFA